MAQSLKCLGRHRFGNYHSSLKIFSLWFLLFFSIPVWSAEYTVGGLPGQTFTTLSAAEAAMRSMSSTASRLQFERVSSETATERVYLYSIPDVEANPSRWSDCQNVPGEFGTAQELCEARRNFIAWDGALTYIETLPGGSLGNGEGFRGKCMDLTRPDIPQGLGNPHYMRTCPTDYFHKNYTAVGGCAGFIVGAGPELMCGNSLTATITERLGACPIFAVTPIPYTDRCATTLERHNSTQAEKDAACGTLTGNMQNALSCFRDKLTPMQIPLVITSGVRNIEYQRHFREIWDKMERIVRLTTNNPTLTAACATRRAELAAEKGCNNAGPCEPCAPATANARNHCLVQQPALPNPNDATHTQGRAIDVDRVRTVDPLEDALNLRNPPQGIQGFLDANPNCNLNWGGNADRVHFQLR